MKKPVLFLLILLTLALGACSVAAPQDAADAADTADVVDTADATAAGQFGESDLNFVLDGTVYPLNSDAAPLIDALGGALNVTTAQSCVYDGEDKQFDFENVSIYTYPTDGVDMIDEVYVFGGDYKTQKGVGIGSTLDEIKEQYGQGEEQGSAYVYALTGDAGDMKSPRLTFEITDGVVSGISFYAASNVAE